MAVNKQKVESGCLLILVIFIIIALIQSKLGCGNSMKNEKTNTYTNNSLDTTNQIEYAFSSCNEEKKYLINSINDLKVRIQDLKKSYRQLKNDETGWDMYISEWNRYSWTLKDKTRVTTFNCIHTSLYSNTVTAFGLIGLHYVHGETSKAKYFEAKFTEFSNEILKQLRIK